MSELELGNLYDMNKEAVLQTENGLSQSKLREKLQSIRMFFLNSSNKYFMLLCRERNDYTLFNLAYKKPESLKQTIEDLKECLINRGKILSIEKESGGAFEIWISIDEQAYAYYLFPYDCGVIEEQEVVK